MGDVERCIWAKLRFGVDAALLEPELYGPCDCVLAPTPPPCMYLD